MGVPPLFELTLVLRLVRMAVARQNLHSIFDLQLIRSLHDCAVSCQFEPRTAPRCRVRRFFACGWGTATSFHSWGWFGEEQHIGSSPPPSHFATSGYQAHPAVCVSR